MRPRRNWECCRVSFATLLQRCVGASRRRARRCSHTTRFLNAWTRKHRRLPRFPAAVIHSCHTVEVLGMRREFYLGILHSWDSSTRIRSRSCEGCRPRAPSADTGIRVAVARRLEATLFVYAGVPFPARDRKKAGQQPL